MDRTDIRSWLRLSKLELAPRRATALVERFGSPEAVFSATETELRSVEGLTGRSLEKLLSPEPSDLDRSLDTLQEKNIRLISFQDKDYPANLQQIIDPPVVLFVRGELKEPDKFAIAIVGSRRASIYGRSMAERIAKDLSNRGLTVISGGARGIDAMAHKGSLAAGGRTVAVLGCGIDICYPTEHKELFDRVAENGAVVSEFSPGTPPEGWRFPARNRIISGLSIGLLVIQAPASSGALITARYAQEQGRDIFVLPGNVDDVRNQGCHALIRDGATLVESADQIMEDLGIQAEDNIKPQLTFEFESLTDEERKLVETLSLQAKHVDQIIQEAKLPAPQVIGMLTMLEMKGIVKRVPGNAYVRAL
ncbi:MAG: DNA-processing protein DprA [Armatimonadota bacterium]